MRTEFDHLVVAADTLERGVAHVEQCLGATCAPGGRHPVMGTHNALLGLGRDRYIEVIAIDPDADAPQDGARWFALDDPELRAALKERPRLLTWVARTPDLDPTLAACTHDPGPGRPMQRGDLHWRIALPEDGALIEHGLVPLLIEWGIDTPHPGRRLPDRGLRLRALRGVHPDPERVTTALMSMGLGDALALAAAPPGSDPLLQAEIETPEGLRWLA